MANEKDAPIIVEEIERNDQLSANLSSMSIVDKRKLLLQYNVKVQVKEEMVVISMITRDQDELHQLNIKAKLVSRGSELKLAISPDEGPAKRDPDPILLRLIAHAFAAQDHLIHGIHQPTVEHYSNRYMHQLVRLSYLAPDVISAIINGTQPPELTGRKVMRQNNIPLDWAGQRAMFGFA